MILFLLMYWTISFVAVADHGPTRGFKRRIFNGLHSDRMLIQLLQLFYVILNFFYKVELDSLERNIYQWWNFNVRKDHSQIGWHEKMTLGDRMDEYMIFFQQDKKISKYRCFKENVCYYYNTFYL